MRLLSAALLVALFFTAPASAEQFFFRSSTTGTISIVPPPPELDVDPGSGIDFGISYGSVRIRSGTFVSISPILSSGRPKTGYSFSSPNLPDELVLDVSSGLIRGRLSMLGIHDFSVTISDGTGQSQTVPVTVVVE